MPPDAPENLNFLQRPIVTRVCEDTDIEEEYFWIAFGMPDQLDRLMDRSENRHPIEYLKVRRGSLVAIGADSAGRAHGCAHSTLVLLLPLLFLLWPL